MTDLTTRPIEPGTSGPALAPVPVNGTASGDRRALRHASRAEQERISADAEIERRARAAQLELELRERRQAGARRERHADEQDKQARRSQRRIHRAARRAKLRAAAAQWADRALFILPILFPMAVAWVGQIRFAMTVMHWPLPAGVVFAAGFELSTAYVARLDWRARAAGDSGLLFRGATWGFAAGAAIMNYWHAAGPDFAPTGEAVSYGLMSLTGVVLWELLSTYRHRTALRAEGKLPAARPRYGLARWIWFRPLTRVAWLLALRDGYTTTNAAWQAALAAVELYGSARGARKAVQAGRPAPRPEPLAEEQSKVRDVDEIPEQAVEHMRDGEDHHADRDITARDLEPDFPKRDNLRDPRDRQEDRDVTERDTAASLGLRDSATDATGPAGESRPDGTGEPLHAAIGDEPANGRLDGLLDQTGEEDDATMNQIAGEDGHDDTPENQEPPVADGPDDAAARDNAAPAGDRQVARPSQSKGALIAKMKAYARERAAQGVSVTGADLDRRFGTRDYGRRVLRQLAGEPDPANRTAPDTATAPDTSEN